MFKRGYLWFMIATFMFLLGASICGAQATAESREVTEAKSEARETWRKSMVRTALPKSGCFTASYPSREWKEVRCVPAPKTPNRPQRNGGKGTGTNTVGNLSGDWDAESSNLLVSAEGQFNSVDVTGGTDTNAYMLQINTQTFSNPPACNNAAGCSGWQQFLYSPTQCSGNPCIFIEYWLLYQTAVTSCPPGSWQLSGGDCFFNGPGSTVTAQSVADMAGLTMTATASAGGQDSVALTTSGGTITRNGQDSVLSLANYWNTTEFNAFGDCCSKETSFNNPTTLVIKTTIDDGTSNAPTCFNRSFTGETNNLNLANTTGSSALVCCPYGGTSPAIEFMETNAGHTATCGPTALIGDPHITTLDGAHYDFQGAGEFVSLREPDGQDIQTRQKPVSTTFIGTDGYDGLTTCVSLNTAVAARVGEHRVTYEPNLSGVPDPSGLQLRVDGALTVIGPQGMALGNGGRVVPTGGGALEMDFPDGKTLFVTPQWWQSQSEWFLNVDVTHHGLVSSGGGAGSTGGIVGPLAEGSWLPALPNGTSLGAMPASLAERYAVLYKKFADAWRVTNKDSLFDYSPGTSTDTFTMKNWPLEKPPCIVPETKPVEPASVEVAEAACRRVMEADRRADCVFDVRATGNPDFAKIYLTAQRMLDDSTVTSLTSDADPSQAGEWVTFNATVVANSTTPAGVPSGTVQFAVDGLNVGEPVTVDAKGRAIWATSALKVGTHQVTASYLPGADSVYLPSTSLEKLQTVKRCYCEAERKYK